MYHIDIVKHEEKKVAAFVLHTTFAENRQAEEIPHFFHTIMAEETLEAVPDRSNENQICAIVKAPDSPAFDYYMGVEVSDFSSVPKEMDTLLIPGGVFAVAPFVKKGNADVLKAFKFLAEEWIPQNGRTLDTILPIFIYYDQRFLPIYKEFGYEGNPIAEINLPLVPA